VIDVAWIDAALRSSRPQAMGALLRYFRDLDQAEEAYQEACLRALKAWPVNGPPRDPAAWLVLVGRNAIVDDIRRRRKNEPLPPCAWSRHFFNSAARVCTQTVRTPLVFLDFLGFASAVRMSDRKKSFETKVRTSILPEEKNYLYENACGFCLPGCSASMFAKKKSFHSNRQSGA